MEKRKINRLYFLHFDLAGFVPQALNKDLSNMIDLGYINIFEAHINKIAPDVHPEAQIGIIIHIKRN